jgi:hypothetical protein
MRKKTIFIALNLCGLLIVYLFYNSCNKSDTTNNKTMQAKQLSINTAVTSGVTLNGVDKTLATKMINAFKADYLNDYGQKSFSAWYSKVEIHQMLSILNNEATADGLRIYFGENSKSGAKLNLQLLLLVTKPLFPSSTDPKISTHEDYFSSNGSKTNKLGLDFNESETTVYNIGGLFYNDQKPNFPNNCTINNNHQIIADSAYSRIQKRDGEVNKMQTYHTISEWYDINFIMALFTAIDKSSSNPNLDGLRIYLGTGLVTNSISNKLELKDMLFLVPTHTDAKNPNMHHDDFSCLDLNIFSKSKTTSQTKATVISSKATTKGSSSYVYDNGELCLPNCNL